MYDPSSSAGDHAVPSPIGYETGVSSMIVDGDIPESIAAV
jgi:hypothetical protein